MNLIEILEAASKLKICVIGDRIIDRYVYGVVERISPEAPVPVLKITGTRENPGGAGNVVENLRGLGCEVDFFYDEKNTIIKTRVMSGSHHIIRMDDEDEPRWMKFDDIQWECWHNIEHEKYNVVVLSDYSKGMISRDVAKKVIELCNMHAIPVVVDTKSDHNMFDGVTLLKCNKHELEAYAKRRSQEDQEEDLTQIKSLVITDGANGITYWSFDGTYEERGHIPGIKTDICDPCGAGDTVLAVLAIMTALGEPIDRACDLANIAASEVCRHSGVYAIKKKDLENHTLPIE
jgi:rfaE bifunctional protein kinase chain/domain